MKQLADDASELLPQDDGAEGGRKRGRGRPKKDVRLVDALHQCWQGKVGGGWARRWSLLKVQRPTNRDGFIISSPTQQAGAAVMPEHHVPA